MARILAYTSPALGHLFPLAPILLELQRRGHTVALRTLAAGVDRMRDAGLDAAPIDGRIEAIALDDYLAKNPAGSIARATTAFAARADWRSSWPCATSTPGSCCAATPA